LGAQELSSKVAKINSKYPDTVSLAAIGLAYLDYDDFAKAKYLDGDIYIDEKKETYKAMSYASLGLLSGYGLLAPSLYKKSNEASSKGITGNLKGDGFQLGGTLLIDQEGNVVWSHEQKSYADYPSEEGMFKAVESYLKV
jgi:prostamide/prostaglandin F2alpha synthase